jgi:hypothetical protein
MSLFQNPLRLWRKEYDRDAPLDPSKCHATATTRGYNAWSHDRHQCTKKPKTTRTFPGGGKALPVCGVHARHYDEELRRHEQREAKYDRREKLCDRSQALREAGLKSASAIGETQIAMDVGELEALVARAAAYEQIRAAAIELLDADLARETWQSNDRVHAARLALEQAAGWTINDETAREAARRGKGK